MRDMICLCGVCMFSYYVVLLLHLIRCNTVLYSFIHSFVRSFVRSFIYSPPLALLYFCLFVIVSKKARQLNKLQQLSVVKDLSQTNYCTVQ